MQIGWWQYLQLISRKASSFDCVGIEYGGNTLQIATLQMVKGCLTWVKQHHILRNEWQKELKHYVAKQKLKNTPCYVSLSLANYQLLQLEKPLVPPDEISQALQWTVKEQLGRDDALVVDYFDLPVAPANTQKLNVVALGKQELCVIRDGIIEAGLNLVCVTVEELSNCNLLPLSDEAAIFLLQNGGEQISLNIVKKGQLYFSRRLRGYENLANLSAQELQLGLADTLALEIQRSMDYFESQLRQAPVKQVYLSLDTSHQETLGNLMKEVLFISITPLLLTLNRTESLVFSSQVYASLGAALESKGKA